MAFHEEIQQPTYGISEDCKYNDHTTCREPRCRCDCHKMPRDASATGSIEHTNIHSPANTVMRSSGLEKSCPQCGAKYAEDRNFCVLDGSRLSSLRCPECGNVAAPEDIYCGYCGSAMKGGQHEPTAEEIEKAAMGDGVVEEAGGMVPIQSDKVQADIPNSVQARFRTPNANDARQKVKQSLKQPIISVGMFKQGG